MQIKYNTKCGKTLKKVLKEDLEISSRLITDLIKNDLITVDGKKMLVNDFIEEGREINIDLNYESNTYEASKINISVIYEDDMILVVNKESGIVVHPTNGVKNGTLLNAISYYQNKKNQDYKIRFVNRIDMGTSGVVVVAKNKYSMNKFSRELSARRVVKEYLVIVNGVIKEEITVNAPLIKELDSPRRIVRSDGKEAITRFIPIKWSDEYTLLKALPLTGRTHQIRSHLAYTGHPILGDELYGSTKYDRLMLHCNKMTFIDLKMTFEAKSDDFNVFFRRFN